MNDKEQLEMLVYSIKELMNDYQSGHMGVSKEAADEAISALDTVLFVHETENIDANRPTNIVEVDKWKRKKN